MNTSKEKIIDAKRACEALYLEVPAAIADDVREKVYALIYEIEELERYVP